MSRLGGPGRPPRSGPAAPSARGPAATPASSTEAAAAISGRPVSAGRRPGSAPALDVWDGVRRAPRRPDSTSPLPPVAARAALVGLDALDPPPLWQRLLQGARGALVGALMIQAALSPVAAGAAPIDLGPAPPPVASVPAPKTGLSPFAMMLADKAATKAELDPAVQKLADQALGRFEAAVRKVVQVSAAQLAEGKAPIRTGADLSTQDRAALERAAQDLLLELPVGALSPTLVGTLERMVAGRVPSGSLATTPLGKLGPLGSQLAGSLARDVARDAPAVAAGLAVAAAVALGHVAQSQGSAGLTDLGIEPRLDLDLLDGRLQVKAEAAWRAGFHDAGLGLDSTWTQSFEDGSSLALQARAKLSGPRVDRLALDSGRLGAQLETESGGAALGVDLGAGGTPTAGDVALATTSEHLDLGVEAFLELGPEAAGEPTIDARATWRPHGDRTDEVVKTGRSTVRELGVVVHQDADTATATTTLDAAALGLSWRGELALARGLGVTTASIAADGHHDHGTAGLKLEHDRDSGATVSARGTWEEGAYRAKSEVRYAVRSGHLTVDVTGAYHDESGVDLELRGHHDNRGVDRIGVGLTFYPSWR